MAALLTLFGGLGALVALLVIVLLKRGGTRTENADGLLIEHEARHLAHHHRTSYNALAVHNSPPTMSDSQRRS
ncbi:hypothetical protein [Streptomyces sp. NPDC059909]|uniref:hypothetical protein n=1 Tax=Streptomyces sp. NPDC059909 TaxID=3346998 RepID=UPI00364FF15D